MCSGDKVWRVFRSICFVSQHTLNYQLRKRNVYQSNRKSEGDIGIVKELRSHLMQRVSGICQRPQPISAWPPPPAILLIDSAPEPVPGDQCGYRLMAPAHCCSLF
ncbi:hypothetical protein BaRGS_00020048 [Batillaria attramentaria]|uniref:Uncharacterized protein n=1 Tax=Batillaria attramentaria TaxID=370345 RepID=A0ABD0KPA5_9CAEN